MRRSTPFFACWVSASFSGLAATTPPGGSSCRSGAQRTAPISYSSPCLCVQHAHALQHALHSGRTCITVVLWLVCSRRGSFEAQARSAISQPAKGHSFALQIRRRAKVSPFHYFHYSLISSPPTPDLIISSSDASRLKQTRRAKCKPVIIITPP